MIRTTGVSGGFVCPAAMMLGFVLFAAAVCAARLAHTDAGPSLVAVNDEAGSDMRLPAPMTRRHEAPSSDATNMSGGPMRPGI
jgi:hypothetical protein